MSFGPNSFEDSLFSNNEPMSILERLTYVKQLFLCRTRLEFRILWNKIFHKEDEELGWLLNPYRQNGEEVTMMTSFNKNAGDSYQFSFDDASNALGREKVTIYSRRVTKKGHERKADDRTFKEKALTIAKYMGMGVYMTSSAFPSPFVPLHENSLYEDNVYGSHMYTMSKIW